MLSIGRMSMGQEGYYNKLAKEDYYLEGGEPPGSWYGEAREDFELRGQVAAQDLTDLFSGSLRGKQLVKTGGKYQRCPGWDLTFSAPKSVSTVWSQADEKTAQLIQECQQMAVEKALSYVESECGITRRGHGGHQQEKVKCLFATFEHGTSRAQQPQLHTHSLMMNVGIREDGGTGAIHSTSLYQHKMAAGAIYRAELANLLGEKLGLETIREKNVFKVIGVSDGLCDHFSDRRKQIEEQLEKMGESGAVASAKLALKTRTNKQNAPRAELKKEWKEIGLKFGFTTQEVEKLAQREWRTEDDKRLQAKLAVQQGAEGLIESNSTFTEKDLVRFTAQAAQGKQIGADMVLEEVKEHLATSQEIIAIGAIDHVSHFTTKAHYELEKALIKKVETMVDSPALKISERAISQAIGNTENPLTEEQEKAVRHILEGEGKIAAVIGDAGTGKTTILKPTREALEKSGYQVRGAALAGKVAEGLKEGAGIDSQTIKSLVWTLDLIEQGWDEKTAEKEFYDWVKEERKNKGPQLGRKELFDPKWTQKQADKSYDRFCKFAQKNALTHKTVLVVDEAAMVDTRNFSSLVDHAEKAGAKLALVGDPKQLQAIQAGGAFTKIAEMVGGARLTEVFRQRDQEEKEAVEKMAAGDVREALTHHAEKGNLIISEDRRAAQSELVEAWAETGIKRPGESLILAGTNLDVVNINREAQERRIEAGAIGGRSLEVGNYDLRRGDRVVFTKRDKSMGVENGSFGTVRVISPELGTMTVELDGEGSAIHRKRTFSVNNYDEVKLGYASTTHKAQGSTIEKAFVLTDESMIDHQISYVQLSRARDTTKIFTTREQAGDDLKDLVRQMERDRQKQLALAQEELAKQQKQNTGSGQRLTI